MVVAHKTRTACKNQFSHTNFLKAVQVWLQPTRETEF